MGKTLYNLDIENEPALATKHKTGGYNGGKQPINQQSGIKVWLCPLPNTPPGYENIPFIVEIWGCGKRSGRDK
jgi:hypothetical protein